MKRLLKGGRVVDPASGLDGVYDLLIESDRIAAVGSGLPVDGSEVSVVDIPDGCLVVPGLIDMHVHLRHAGVLPLFLAHGVTTVRNMNGYFGEAKRWADETSDGSRLGPRIINASPTIRQDQDSSYQARADTPELARALAQRFAREGWDWIKVYQVPEAANDALGEAASALGIPVAGHIPWYAPQDSDVEASRRAVLRAIAPMTTVEHMGGFLYGWFRDSADTSAVPAFAAAIAGSGVEAVTPTLAQDYVLARIVEKGAAALSPDDRALVERYTGPEGIAALDATVSAMYGSDPWLPDFQREMAVALHRAGVTLLLGTDSHSPFALAGRSLHDEAELWEAGGIEQVAILRAATIDAARILRLEQQLGAVEPGFVADLVLLDGSPLKTASSLRQISGVVLGGVWFDRGAIEKWLNEAAAAPPYCRAPRCA